jgi:hypothetical protein
MKSRRKFLTLSVGMATETALRFQMAGSGNPMTERLRPPAYKYGRLRDVNTTDILDAIRLGCHTMQNIFNADLTFFDSFEN